MGPRLFVHRRGKLESQLFNECDSQLSIWPCLESAAFFGGFFPPGGSNPQNKPLEKKKHIQLPCDLEDSVAPQKSREIDHPNRSVHRSPDITFTNEFVGPKTVMVSPPYQSYRWESQKSRGDFFWHKKHRDKKLELVRIHTRKPATLLGTNISLQKGTFDDYFLFLLVG